MPRTPVRSPVRRWLKRIFLGLAGLLVLAVVAGSIYEAVAWRRTLETYPPPGRMVDIGGRSMHIDCRGTGSPTVVFEAGLDVAGAIAWTLVHDSVAATTRACAYNRAGIVWSDPSPAPHNGITVANDLHATLAAAGETGPFVLVGHSLGGPYIMTYTKLYGADVAGLVFVDASHPEQVARMERVTGKATEPPFAMLELAAKLSWTGLVRLAASQVSFPKLPDQRPVEAIRAYLPRSLGQELMEAASIDSTFAEAGTFRDLGDRPIVVLTAMAPIDSATLAVLDMSPEQGKAFQGEWHSMHVEQAGWSTRSRHEVLVDASHYIQMDRPDAVIRAVREVVDSVRARP